jgi:hypothetical protein
VLSIEQTLFKVLDGTMEIICGDLTDRAGVVERSVATSSEAVQRAGSSSYHGGNSRRRLARAT